MRRAGETIDIVTPTGGESVTEGTILEWSVKVGDTVKQGDTVVEISTDKVDMELPAPASGQITEILAEEGETVTVGQVIARMSRRRRPTPPPRPTALPRPDGPTAVPAHRATAGSGRGRRAATPRRSPGGSPPQQGIDLTSVHGSARGGRITKADVLAAAAGNGAATAPAPAAEQAAGADADQGRRRRARALHGREPLDPDRDLVPDARRDRRSSSAAGSSRRPAAASRSRT